VAVSRYVKAAHERHLPESRGRTEVVYNWPTTESDGPLAPLPPLPERFALFVGAASPHKGFPFLLRLWREIDLDLPLVAFVTGSRVEIERILASAESRVYMHVNVDHRVVLLAWRKALMGLVPSLWPETFCLVALEAMTAGCPVIASSLGGLPEVVGDAGLLLPPGDMTAWREEVLRLASDDALRAALGEQGRERARELFSRERGVTALVRLYREVAGRSML
jgi:glycosyltransferase involved in cell wall biosynthesis